MTSGIISQSSRIIWDTLKLLAIPWGAYQYFLRKRAEWQTANSAKLDLRIWKEDHRYFVEVSNHGNAPAYNVELLVGDVPFHCVPAYADEGRPVELTVLPPGHVIRPCFIFAVCDPRPAVLLRWSDKTKRVQTASRPFPW